MDDLSQQLSQQIELATNSINGSVERQQSIFRTEILNFIQKELKKSVAVIMNQKKFINNDTGTNINLPTTTSSSSSLRRLVVCSITMVKTKRIPAQLISIY